MSQEPITSLKGIGEKTGKLFERLGIHTVDELLEYYPRTYDIFEKPVKVRELKPDTLAAVEGVLMKNGEVRRFSHIQVTLAFLFDGQDKLQLTWYNMPFLASSLKSGSRFVFRGRVVKKSGRLTMEQPEMFSLESYQAVEGSMQPVYGQTKGLGNKAIVRAVSQALKAISMVREYLPSDIRIRQELAEYNFALEHIHFPSDRQEFLFARKRMVFDEFFLFLLAVRRLKEKREYKKSRFVMKIQEEAEELKKKLPYSLTEAQERALQEIYSDLSSGLIMNRLVQGDVGSGKTILAVLALLQAACNGFQGALMAPTEVLAKQHFQSVTELFETYGIKKKVVLVTGSMTAKEKRTVYEQIASHEADIIIGTHALIQEKVVYDKLALVITDEQHRFGVGQREALGSKGEEPHVLVMSATPIPRTLAIIIYGDLDISVIDQLPASRLPVKNCVVNTSYRKKAYDFIAKQVAEGRQAYVICPMVEKSEMIEAEDVLDYTRMLKSQLPPSICVEYLHGKMKGKEKNAVMERFAANEIQVLVSTTVIEVGVNVPNATVMMIENAERFGLAQLHQLRGRVGRGKYQSYCIMVNCGDEEGTSKRLDILNRSNDGFYIASEDLKLRGPGDIFGLRQSGDMEFRLADIFTDASVLKTASEEVNRLLADDPGLAKEDHEELRKRLDSYLERSYEKLNL